VHTVTRRGVSPQNFNAKNLKFGLKFSVCIPIISALVGVSSRNFQTTRGRGDNVVQFWEGLPPKIWEGKNVQISAPFLNNFRLWSRISPERIDMLKIGKKPNQLKPFQIGQKNWWTLVHKQKSSRGAYWHTQVDIFRETTFRALVGADPSDFYTCYRLTQAT